MNRKKKENAAQSTRQLMGIDSIKNYCIATRMGDLVFFIIKPTNISVLSDSSISARIYALLNVVKGQAEIEMLALNSKESFERNKNFYQERMGSEELPAIRRLLEQDSKHLDRIQVLMASSREFYIIIRLRSEKETDVFPYVACCGTSIQPVLKLLERQPEINTVLLCLDNDEAGHLASRRMEEQLAERYTVERLIPTHKDWNDDLTAEEPSYAQVMQ